MPIDTTLVSSPVFLKGSFKYTADVRASAIGFPLDWGMGSANLQATFLGLEPVAVGSGESIPEPSTFDLLGSGLIVITLGRLGTHIHVIGPPTKYGDTNGSSMPIGC